MWFIGSLFSFILCCVCLLSTFCLSCLCQYVTKRGRNIWNLGIMLFLFRGRWNCFRKGEKVKVLFFYFYVSNLGGKLVCIFVICCYCIFVTCCLSVFISTHAVMCSLECLTDRDTDSADFNFDPTVHKPIKWLGFQIYFT